MASEVFFARRPFRPCWHKPRKSANEDGEKDEPLRRKESKELRDWLEADVAEVEHRWVLEAQERLHGINAGERTPIVSIRGLFCSH